MKKDYSKISSLPFKIRAVQLDLARHYEKVAYVKEYMAFCAACGFNTVVLYLEGRVKTPSFPHAKIASYSTEEITDIGIRAKELGMNLIPVIPALGHAEQFFASGDLKHISEERDGAFRFSAQPSTFCPSLDETKEFLSVYLTEISELFPGSHFHAGLDEAWNFGLCNICSKKVKEKGLGKLFVEHVRTVHGILKRNGKRMWMWDDMFEFFPEELPNIPKDIVMAHWSYGENIDRDGTKCHFVNGFHNDWLDLYERLGLDAVVCPWVIYRRNIETITDYGRRKNILGGLLTQWEGTPRLNPEDNRLLVSFTGKLWTSDDFNPERTWRESIGEVFKGCNSEFHSGVSLISSRQSTIGRSDIKSYFRGALLSAEEWMQREMLRDGLSLIKGGSSCNFENIAAVRYLHLNLRELLGEIYDPRRLDTDIPRLKDSLESYRHEYLALKDGIKTEMLKSEFSTDDDLAVLKSFDCIGKHIENALTRIDKCYSENEMVLKMRLFCKDHYGIPGMRIVAVDKDGREYQVAEGVFKSFEYHEIGGFYDYYFPYETDNVPVKIMIEYSGYGGQGIAYFESQSRSFTLVPSSVRVSQGIVQNLDAILTDDYSFVYFGNPDSLAAIHNPDIASEKTIVEVSLIEKK